MTTSDGKILGKETIISSGPNGNRFNIVILGDGFTEVEIKQYKQEAKRISDYILEIVQINNHKHCINIHRVDVTSTDSGADDPASAGGTGATARTFFDATFGYNGLRRSLVVNDQTAINVATNRVPEWHLIIVIVNSLIYGGSGGSVATLSLAPGSEEIAVHEMGHTAFHLADEYPYYDGCGQDTDKDRYSAGEPVEPNVTIYANPTNIKWKNLIKSETPLPTTNNPNCRNCDYQVSPVPVGTVGAFEGAFYFHCGIYRPEYNCKMRQLGEKFCTVCQRSIREVLQHGGYCEKYVPKIYEEAARNIRYPGMGDPKLPIASKIKVDLYSDRGKLLKEDVSLDLISPLKNTAIQKLINLTKRTVAVNLAGIEGALKTGKVAGGRRQIKGRELNYDVVANANALADKIKALLQVDPSDDTNVKVLGGGRQLLVQIPTARINAASEFVVGSTAAAATTVEAIVQEFKVGMADAPMVHAAVWGEYPQTVGMNGGNVASVLNIPQNDEGLGFALRNVMANHFAAITKRNAMNAAALASIYEQIGEFEMGNAMGIFEIHQLLGMAYQGLNANNMVYETVKANGKTGTIGTVAQTIVATALEHRVIREGKKLPSGYVLYEASDVSYWNAYCAAGALAATMVNCGALRGAQAVSSTLLYFNDIIEKETSLPGCDFGRTMGTAVGFSFFSHSIYGGGGPGVFSGNHVVTRHSRGFAIPCVAAAVALDAGTQMFTPEMTSGLVGAIYGEIKEFREPIVSIAETV